MDYEQKYKEALERMKSWVRGEHPECFSEAQKAAEFIFPELKESEEEINERVRIGLIKAFNTIGKLKWGGLKVQDILTWLEKQQGKSALEAWRDMRFEVYQQASGNRHEPNYSDDSTKMFSLNDIDEIIEKISEQSHNDKIKQKFHKGAWVVSEVTGSVYQIKDCIENVTNHKYGYDLTNGKYIGSCEVNHYHLWTINDANDGDVLVDEDNNIGLYSGEKDDLYWHSCIYLGCDDYLRGSMGYHKHENTKPATKEQRDLLIEKMEQAGYEWDAEKKELKKIEVVSKESEDERIRKALIEMIHDTTGDECEDCYHVSKESVLSWLEKQGEKKNTRKREIHDAYLQGVCDTKHEIEKQGKKLDADALRRGALWADAHPHWISVEEELPIDYEPVLAVVGGNHFAFVGICLNKTTWYCEIQNKATEIIGITHWMPLPQAPKKGGEE